MFVIWGSVVAAVVVAVLGAIVAVVVVVAACLYSLLIYLRVVPVLHVNLLPNFGRRSDLRYYSHACPCQLSLPLSLPLSHTLPTLLCLALQLPLSHTPSPRPSSLAL